MNTNLKYAVILFFLVSIQFNAVAQRDDYFSVTARYFTPIYDAFNSLEDDLEDGIDGKESLFTKFEGSFKLAKWLKIGGFVNFNSENDNLINTALRIGIKKLEFSYETGNFQGSLDNSFVKIGDNMGPSIPIGDFSNDYKSFVLFYSPGIDDANEYYLSQYGIGFTSLNLPAGASVELGDFRSIEYVDPRANYNFYAFHQKIDNMYGRLTRITSVDNKFGVDFSSANIAGIVTIKASDFGKDQLESVLRNGINGEDGNPNGFISSEKKGSWGFGISSDTRLGAAYTSKDENKKIAFAVAAGYSFRAFFFLTAAIEGEEPDGDEYYQSSFNGTSVLQHGPYLKAQINW
ncbi:hypothetical protein [Croceibacter atlanticus]|uniref:hypothetical protein n=1 Tax=Croceibacter atlanticus TaxID=313588 RepID=UPI000C8A891B|nr:hypothetical protein [Croceibacter sp.]WSP34206.1 hypothetical protein VVL01_12435 [Croceibacter atlanticus]|tara:strand:+ start:70 stop:1110 length:1041 start_codon:yes stop_codon:yes gene_type:complete